VRDDTGALGKPANGIAPEAALQRHFCRGRAYRNGLHKSITIGGGARAWAIRSSIRTATRWNLGVRFECVAEVGGPQIVDRVRRLLPATFGTRSAQQRHERHLWRGPWWALPAENTLDLATATLPFF